MSSASAIAGRPGIAQGTYPERREERAPPMARALRAAVGWLSVPRRASGAQVREFAARVESRAAGLHRLADSDFDAALAELREALRRDGLCDGLLPRGFALVREAARRALGTPHYDVQLYGGWVMARQGLAELETGEGKTLTATLPASLAALAGIPVHVITANDYLVERDAEAMRPLYTRLGLRVGTVLELIREPEARREAYACDVTYVTHKQVAFDYLRDRLAGAGRRGLSAQWSLEGARPGAGPVMRGLCFALIDEADSALIDDARTPLILSQLGAPHDERVVRAALRLARALEPGRHYRLDRRRARVQLLEAGREFLEERAGALPGPLAGARRREEWVERALYADCILERNHHYLVRGDAVDLIDLPTGRRSPDRAFEGVVHALIEAKCDVPISPQRESIARISYQSFFRRYLRLAGMTGTAREVAGEIFRVYGLRTVAVPTRRPSRRVCHGLRLFPGGAERFGALVQRVRELHQAGRPVLIGTASVDASQELSALLRRAGLEHQVLSAQQDAGEAQIIARAGEAGRITVATRMAGRGTDIQLGPGVEDLGGLAVIGTELGEARRIDRQLFGRCARQGQPGSYERWLALDDPLVAARTPAWLRQGARSGSSLCILLMSGAQWAEERRGALARRRLLEHERSLAELLAFSSDS